MGWGGRGGWWGPWPGRGPFSHLPPWERPGWLYGRGACWWAMSRGWPYGSPYAWPYGSSYPSYPAPGYGFRPIPIEDEIAALEESKKNLQEELKGIEARVQELQKPPKKETA
jgi:hypothetical protein